MSVVEQDREPHNEVQHGLAGRLFNLDDGHLLGEDWSPAQHGRLLLFCGVHSS